MTDATSPKKDSPLGSTGEAEKLLPPAAERALAEAAERRRKAEQQSRPAEELGGRGGLDPARYGDWEKAGLTSDF